MSQALFAALWKEESGRKVSLVSYGVGTLWTEHSERAMLRSWSQAARVPGDIRKMLGRWQQTVDEGYERTARVSILKSQRGMARFVRGSLGMEDPFDESAVLQLVGRRTEEMGLPEDARQTQAELLMTYMPVGLGAESGMVPDWMGSADDGMVDAATSPASSGKEWSGDEAESEAEVAAANGRSLRGQFVISVLGRSKTRTLHKVGECYRIPGVHYLSFEACGEDLPEADRYHRACKVCFREGGAPLVRHPEDESSGEVSSSDTGSGGD